MKQGFTLAEVLITLGIIGVVVAMTIPTLIQKHNNHVVETKLKKVYSVMNQALNMSELENGDKTDWVNELRTLEGMQKYLLPYLKTTKAEEDEGNVYLYLADGSILIKPKSALGNWHLLTGKLEKCNTNSEVGKCNFAFYYNPFYNPSNNYASGYTKQFEPYDYGWHDKEYDTLKQDVFYGCKKDANNYYCTKLIQVNGWKIPKDYPYKVR